MHLNNFYILQLLFISLSIIPFVFGGNVFTRLKNSDSESKSRNIQSTSSTSSNQANVLSEPPKPEDRKSHDKEIFTLEWVESYEKDVQHILSTCESINIAEWKKEPELVPSTVFKPVDKAISFLRSDIAKAIPSKKPLPSNEGNKIIGDLALLKDTYIKLMFEEAPKLFKLFLNDYSYKIPVFKVLAKPEDQDYDFVAEGGLFPAPVKVTVSNNRITFKFPFISAHPLLEEYNIKDKLRLVKRFNQFQIALENASLIALKYLFRKALVHYCEENGLKSQQNEDS